MSRTKTDILQEQEVNDVLKKAGITPLPKKPREIDITEIEPLKPRIIQPRAVGDLLPAPRPTPQPKKVSKVRTVEELLAQMDPPFNPLLELVTLYREATDTVIDKEGKVHQIPIKAETRASILKDLLTHIHVKPKPIERKDDAGEFKSPPVQIITYGDVHLNHGNNASPRVGTPELSAPSLDALRTQPEKGEGSMSVAPAGG